MLSEQALSAVRVAFVEVTRIKLAARPANPTTPTDSGLILRVAMRDGTSCDERRQLSSSESSLSPDRLGQQP
jgi:hypothetical protein